MRQLLADLLSELTNAWRTRTIGRPIGKVWLRAVGRSVEPITWEGWLVFYAIITLMIGGAYYAITGRDPLGLAAGRLLLLDFGFPALLVAFALIGILKTDFSR